MSRLAVYNMGLNAPRWEMEVTVDDEHLGANVRKFWRDGGDVPGGHLLLLE